MCVGGGEKIKIKKGVFSVKTKKKNEAELGVRGLECPGGVRSAAAGPCESSCRLPCPCRLPPPLLLSLPPPPPPLRPSGQQLSTSRGDKSASRRGFQNKSMWIRTVKQWEDVSYYRTCCRHGVALPMNYILLLLPVI